jgi:hypothetical protein
MITSFAALERAHTIVLTTPLLTLAATVCDMLERAGIPAALSREKGCPIVVVPSDRANETTQLLATSWACLA